MIIYGWTESEVYEAIAYVNRIYREADSRFPLIIPRYHPEVVSYNCRRGKHTLRFLLGFEGSARKTKGTYPPGCAWTDRDKIIYVKDRVPLEEFYGRQHRALTHWKERRSPLHGGRPKEIWFTRSTGSLCWHAFGHFMTWLFDKNPDGKIRTGANVYENQRDYEQKAGYVKWARECACGEHALEYFFNLDDKETT